MIHPILKPAMKVCALVNPQSEQKLPPEILVLDQEMVAIVVDIDGVDYILTMAKVPGQRPRPTAQ